MRWWHARTTGWRCRRALSSARQIRTIFGSKGTGGCVPKRARSEPGVGRVLIFNHAWCADRMAASDGVRDDPPDQTGAAAPSHRRRAARRDLQAAAHHPARAGPRGLVRHVIARRGACGARVCCQNRMSSSVKAALARFPTTSSTAGSRIRGISTARYRATSCKQAYLNRTAVTSFAWNQATAVSLASKVSLALG